MRDPRVAWLLAAAAATSCARPPTTIATEPTGGAEAESEARRDERWKSELEDDILSSYERDEPPEIETAMIRADVGGGRFGVGPDDVWIAEQQLKAPTRWPLAVERGETAVRSKRLDLNNIWLARDRSAAWVYDEISWRITVCNRTAVVPLRMTALYAHDGDRWIPVFEHLSFAHTPVVTAGDLRGATFKSKKVTDDISDALSEVLAQSLFKRDAPGWSNGPEDVLLGPDVGDEWIGSAVARAGLDATTIVAKDRRVGVVGRNPAKATIAYWIGNFDADYPARGGLAGGKIRLRGTFVFEKRDNAWKLVSGQLSAPIDDPDLASVIFGTSLESLNPVRVGCGDSGGLGG